MQPFTPASGKWFSVRARFQVSTATGIGVYIGMTTGGAAAALPFGTNYTDVVAIRKAITSATVTGHTRGNSGTAVDTTLVTTSVANTEMDIGFAVYVHATEQQGYWYADGTITPMTTAELAQVALLLTTPQVMYATLHVTGVTATNPTLTVTSFLAQVDN